MLEMLSTAVDRHLKLHCLYVVQQIAFPNPMTQQHMSNYYADLLHNSPSEGTRKRLTVD
jgi:hypothetical protein